MTVVAVGEILEDGQVDGVAHKGYAAVAQQGMDAAGMAALQRGPRNVEVLPLRGMSLSGFL